MADALHIHLDVLGGVAGEMFVAAMLDALPDLRPRVLADVAYVLPSGVALVEGASGGFVALRFVLAPTGDAALPADYAGLATRIALANLPAGTATHATAILRLLARAEARTRRVDPADLRFEQTAARGLLSEAVAAGSIVAALDGARWSVSALPLGGSAVRTRHGVTLVPSPVATALLRGFRWRDDGVAGVRITPIGAAILRHLADPAATLPAGATLLADGTGAAAHDLPGIPNVLRALIFEVATLAANETMPDESVIVLTFDIDDMTGEEIGVAADRLRALCGVLDLSLGTRLGKKGRPLHEFRLLLRPDALPAVRERCFAETSTIGLRWRLEQRAVLARRTDTVCIDSAEIRRKHVARPGGETVKAESDDVAVLEGLETRRKTRQEAEAIGQGRSDIRAGHVTPHADVARDARAVIEATRTKP